MKQLKKTLLTLALLLTAATGAWAQSAVASIGSENYTTLQAAFTAAETGQTIKLLSDVTQVGGVGKSDGKAVTFDLNGHIYTCTDDYSVMATYNSQITIIDSSTGTPGGIKSELALIGQGNGKIIIKAGRYNIGNLSAKELLLEAFPNWCVEMYSGYTLQDITPADAQGFCVGVVAPASSALEVAWTAASKTGTFTMPGGNVTLEPDYYPQAALTAQPTAINNVPATTDGAIVSAGTVANIGETTTAQGTVMYYVSPSALDDAALQALAADQWTADVPTAAGLAKGQAYVYYYVRGNDSDTDEENFSDGDILAANALTVTIAPAPTYAVTFADGTEESDKWTASPAAGVTKGETVTVTYTGSKKVIGVKAEKKAAAPAETTVTLTTGEIGDLFSGGSTSKTINGITIEVSGDAQFYTTGLMDVSAMDPFTGELIPTTGTYTFTSSVGNIKRIDINHKSGNWREPGAGWPGSYNVSGDNNTFTWSGTPAASVTLSGSSNDVDQCSLYSVSSFVFTIEPTN